MKFFEGWNAPLAKHSILVGIPDHDPDPGIFNAIYTIAA